MAIIAGAKTIHQVHATWKAGFWSVMKVSWITSPLALAFAQKFLPEHTWVPFFNIISFSHNTTTMGIMSAFTRRPRATSNGDTVPPTHADKTSSRAHHKSKKTPVVMDFSRRPTFGQWLKVTFLDIATMAAMGAIGLGVSLHLYLFLDSST